MRLSRRQMLAGGVAAGVAGVGVAVVATLGRGIAAHTLDIIREVYGAGYADQPAALEFARAYESFVLQKGLSGRLVHHGFRFGLHRLPGLGGMFERIDDSVVEKFAQSTNVILAAERGDALEFIALFQPFESPCVNQLSAQAIS